MREVIFIAFVLVIGSSTFDYVLGQQLCYECSDVGDSTCSDRYFGMAEHMTECSYYGYGCSKTKSDVKAFGFTVTTTTRACGTSVSGSNSNCKKPYSFSFFGVKTKTWECSCYTDYCNSGTQLAVSSALIVSALAKFML